MKQTFLFWVFTVVITLFLLVYQRVTGPTYPISGKAQLNGKVIPYEFKRSYDGVDNAPVQVKTDDQSITGVLFWRRFRTNDGWTQVPMMFGDGSLKGELPHQPIAGKLMYKVELTQGEQHIALPGTDPIVIRFRNPVPIWIIIPHVLAMFGAFLFSVRAGLEFFNKEPKFRKFIYTTLGFLVLGGFILGPLMQYFSFNIWWAGWPMGTDLTDNKTAGVFIVWALVALLLAKVKNPKRWVLGASIITIVVYLIPHSLLGSEYDYNKLDKQNTKTEAPQ